MATAIDKSESEKLESLQRINTLQKIANQVRAYALLALHCAQSGHGGGSLSAADLITAAYFGQLRHDPKNPRSDSRDRFFIGKDHACPALYSCLALCGYFPIKEVMNLRQIESKFQGHPDPQVLAGVELPGGSLGQALGVAVGSALAGKMRNQQYQVFCLMGDGEQQEGSIWEAAMSAAHFQLGNLTGIIDRNKLQIDGATERIVALEPLAQKYAAFGWEVMEIDGHNFEQILAAYERATANRKKPLMIIAHTIKGKGVSFMENNIEWHSKKIDYPTLLSALKELEATTIPVLEYINQSNRNLLQTRSKLYTPSTGEEDWNKKNMMKTTLASSGEKCAEAILAHAQKNIIPIFMDSCRSIFKVDYQLFDSRLKERGKVGGFNLGIAEQNAANVAAGLAKEGFIPFLSGYAVFSCGRNWEQIRNTICLGNFNVKIIGLAGITVGGDGASHQALEDISIMACLPQMHVFSPCDALEAGKITTAMIDLNGPCYMRLSKAPTPLVTKEISPFQFGQANTIRFRAPQESFSDAFEIILSSEYQDEREDLALLSTGVLIPQVMMAAYLLKKERGLETRIINFHTLKPIDRSAIERVAREIKFVFVVEDHQDCGLGNIVAGILGSVQNKTVELFKAIGLHNQFGTSGDPDDLLRYFHLDGLSIKELVLKEILS